MLNPWIPYPDLTTVYRNRLVGGDGVAHPVIQPRHQPPKRRRRIHRVLSCRSAAIQSSVISSNADETVDWSKIVYY